MSTQLWDVTLYSTGGCPPTVSATRCRRRETSPGVILQWPLTLIDGTLAPSPASATRRPRRWAPPRPVRWYDYPAHARLVRHRQHDVAGRRQRRRSQQPTAATGIANTLSQAADFAPFTVIAPPSVTGVGNTISSAYGSALRSFNTVGQDAEGGFDIDQQRTDSVLVRPTASGDFIIDGLPLPS